VRPTLTSIASSLVSAMSGANFARDCPPPLAPPDDAQLLLECQRIDFYHTTVDREVELTPDLVLEIVRPFLDLIERAAAQAMGRHGNSPLDQRIEQL